ncbi:hypothetical protein [Arachnia propionica]|uniref:Uncharacterized protein n=1 Tax=Arachnia propionica TaxID=1750 RepID=A0A3P1WVS0_9ACTN|nr:hypothetical protein [Arachnia propionica]RRD50734.1 hypothetical protein EII35_03105 [Arachnia propionica]
MRKRVLVAAGVALIAALVLGVWVSNELRAPCDREIYGDPQGAHSVTFSYRREGCLLRGDEHMREPTRHAMVLAPGERQALSWRVSGPPVRATVASAAGEIVVLELSGQGCVDFVRGAGEHQLLLEFPRGSGEGHVDWGESTACA